jgi:LasA protease
MQKEPQMHHFRFINLALLLLVLMISLACVKSVEPLSIPAHNYSSPTPADAISVAPAPTSTASLPVVRSLDDTSIASPTPNNPVSLPELRREDEQYTVQAGDTLGTIAARYRINAPMILQANEIPDPNLLSVGQELVIPAPIPGAMGTGFKIIPDSELVYGPYAQSFDINGFISQFDSYLGRYSEEVEGQTMTGPEIVKLVAQDYSVNPRLLLAVLEYQSGWVTRAGPAQEKRDYPLGNQDSWRKGLYLQLCWAANNLNRGYYLWRVNGIGGWLVSNGEIIPIDPSINAGTAGVQQLFALLYDRTGWDQAVSPEGVYKIYSDFFGYPFDYAYNPVLPDVLEQPPMQLPFEPGVNWAFTGGPHGGWGDGSAWAAIDFAPGSKGLGCVESDLWVVAAADGLIVRADAGRVIEDLDGDGNEGTGWSILYMHIEGRDRVEAGTQVKAGDRIGHPSCTGGYSTGTHFHLARRYNGEWIPADLSTSSGGVPFNLDGWISSGNGTEYDGYLTRDGESIEAWEGFFPENTIYK